MMERQVVGAPRCPRSLSAAERLEHVERIPSSDVVVRSISSQRLYNAAVLRIALDKAWPDVVAALRDDPTFRTSLADQLRAVPYAAWFWECIRVSDGPFECVVIEASSLARTADPSAFAEYLTSPINTFKNLGGDTVLIAPSPTGSYPHFAAFLRTAPAGQADELFRAIGNAVADWEGAGPPWVSTAGMGVPWLHVRLDTRPKYYRHAPYRSVSRGS